MTLESLLAQLDVMVEAPLGVQRVRELLLQLAFRGKLADPVPAEAPERSSNDSVLAIASELASFPIPEGWRWARLSEVAESRLGKMLDAAKNRGIALPYLRNTNVQWFRFALEDVKTMRFDASEIEEYTVQGGDLLLCEGGEPGRGAVWPEGAEPIMFQKALHRVRPLPCLDVHFLLYWIRSCFEAGRLDALYTGATIKHLTGKSLARLPVPVPPLAEQRRIVAKVDELMALCDEIEMRQERRADRESRLRSATIVELAQPTGSIEQPESAWKLAARLPWLVRASEDVVHLRRAILELAVTGKLAIDPSSEVARINVPAEGAAGEMLTHYAAPTPQTSASHLARAACPPGWKYVKAGELLSFVTSGSRGWAKHYAPDGALFLRIGNLDYDTTVLDLSNVQHVRPPEDAEGTRTRVRPGDVLVSITGDTGMVGLVPKGFPEAYINQHIALARPKEVANASWLAWYFASPFARAQLHQAQRGIKNSLGLADITAVQVLLPPLSEQRRIIEAVERMFALCDELESQLMWSTESAEHLALSLLRSVSSS